MILQGKTALITGASRGIGRSIAIELAKAGVSVAINFSKDLCGAEETLKQVREIGGYGFIVQGDISKYDTAKAVVEKVVNTFGKIDILVNNAGVSKIGLFMDMKEEDWDSIMNINLKGVFNCCHNAVPYMVSEKKGCIINISSIWGNAGASCEVIYSASKGGINSFTKALAKELAPSNITVNAIAPGVINTEMNQWLSKEEQEALIDEIPMMRMGEGEEIGKAVVFLAGEGARYITGQVLTIDGGML